MGQFNANEVINGRYGFLFDENGKEMQTTQEMEAGVELQKAEIPQAGVFYTAHKVSGGKITGKVTMLKVDSRLQKKVADDPTAKFNYLAQLKDPTARGEEAVLLKGVSFDNIDLIKYAVEEPKTAVEMNFTADGFEYKETID
jgi:hypothetical protein